MEGGKDKGIDHKAGFHIRHTGPERLAALGREGAFVHLACLEHRVAMAAKKDRLIAVTAGHDGADGVAIGLKRYGFMWDFLCIKEGHKPRPDTVDASLVKTVAVDINKVLQ